jgi:iron(III) transport system ATP-binding protein
MTDLVLSNVSRAYGSVLAIDDISLSVKPGEFLTLLGPSGCGKSTTLAAIAGLDQPTKGRISFQDKVLFDADAGIYLPPEARGFGVVFQSYALWPHMTVEANVGLALKLRKVAKAQRKKRIGEVLELVGLNNFAARYPGELSGGQQQRVALARAIVFRPPLLLLDEPLSNLDAQLRQSARVWLKDIQQELGLTAIYVTHDQEEALAMSDRIVVMRSGRIVQVGTPEEIYKSPSHPFAATFIGGANVIALPSCLAGPAGARNLTLSDGQTVRGCAPNAINQDRTAEAVIRPQSIRLDAAIEADSLNVSFGAVSYLGDHYEQEVHLAGNVLRMTTVTPQPTGPGQIWLNEKDVLVFEAS